jgi:transposase
LGFAESMLYSWRSKRRQIGQPFEEQKLQQAELSRLNRENARLEEEVTFLKAMSLLVVEHNLFLT